MEKIIVKKVLLALLDQLLQTQPGSASEIYKIIEENIRLGEIKPVKIITQTQIVSTEEVVKRATEIFQTSCKHKCRHTWSPWVKMVSTWGADQGWTSTCSSCNCSRYKD